MNFSLHLVHRIILQAGRFLFGGWSSMLPKSLLLLFLTANTVLAQGPTISSFSPTSGGINSSVIISGSNFVGTTSVRFGEVSAQFTVNSNSQLTVTVPRVASTQPILVTNASGYALTASDFTVTRTSSSLTYNLVTSNFGNINAGSQAAPAVGDLDNDGLLDLLVGRNDGTVSRYEQTAANGTSFSNLGSLTDGSSTINMGGRVTVSMVDTDGDGKFSVLLGRSDGYVYEYEQDAINSSTFALVTTSFGDVATTTFAVVGMTDFTGDGLLEFLTGKGDNYIGYFYQGDVNSPNFYRSDANFLSLTSNTAPFCVDLDGNGLIDVLIGEGGGSIYRFEQSSANSSSLTQLSSNFNSISAGANAKPCVTDIDGDGLLDLLVGRADGTIDCYEQALSSNVAPTDISLSPASVSENQPVTTMVGTLTTTDPNLGNTFTYTFASGGADNGSFNISGSTLKTNDVFDYEVRNSYSIKIRSTDQGGLFFEKELTVAVTNVLESLIITSFSPTTGLVGASIILTGTHFSDAGNATVRFNGTLSSAVTVNSNTQITATVPSGATTGTISVQNADGTGMSSTIFTVTPQVSSVSVPANSTYGIGSALTFSVVFNQAVTVTGAPNLPLTVGGPARTASYVSGSGGTTLVFTYVVVDGDLDNDGVILGSALNLNGGTIKNGTANANLTLTNVAPTTGVRVDGVAPTVSITSTESNPTATSPIPLSIAFSESVTGFAVGDITVTNATRGTLSGSGANYTLPITPSGTGAVTILVNVAANVVNDGAGNGNAASNTFTINYSSPPAITGFTALDNTICLGSPITVTATVGNVTGSYAYTLTNGSSTLTGNSNTTTFSQNLIASGSGLQSFTLTVSSNGQLASASTTLTVNPLPTNASLTSTTLSCAQTSVTLTASATGGTSYTLSDGQTNTTGQFVVNQSGNYTVTSANSSGCTMAASATVFVDQMAPSVNISPSSTTLTCAHPSATLTVVGAGSIRWNTGSMASQISVNRTDTYSVTLTSPNGCTATASAQVFSNTVAPSVSINPSSATLTCASPSVSLTAVGTGSVLWSTGSTGNQISVNSSGTYSVTLTNANGCTATASVVIDQDQAAPSVNITPSSATLTCASPSVLLTAVGTGSAVWSTGSTASAITVNSAGIYSVTLTSANGCTAVASGGVVQDQTAPSVSISPSATAICAGQITQLTASGADTYQWSTSQTTASISASATGTYSVTGTTTANGCSRTATASVNVIALPDARFMGLSTSVCVDASLMTFTPTTAGGSFSGPGISGNQFNPVSAGVGGPYTITYTVTSQGCANSSSQSVTVKPQPAAPTLVTQSGHAYPGGVSELTISQNTGDVILMVGGCAGGSINWAGGSAATFPVSTSATGTFTYQAYCTINECSSLAATVTVTVVAPTLSVQHRDADYGNTGNGIIKPYLQLSNAGNQAIPYSEVTVRYWFTSEGSSLPTDLAVYYAQLGPVQMKYVALDQPRQGAYGYIEYNFQGAGSLAANSNSGPIENAIQKADHSNFNELDDYSYAANYATYTPNSHITAYRNGVIFWGQEPDLATPQTSIRAYSAAKDSPTASQVQIRLEVRNEGNTSISVQDLSVRYYFTSDNGQLANVYVDYADIGASNVQAQVVRLASPVGGADSYVELKPMGSATLAPMSSLGAIDFRLVRSDYGLFDQTNDYSYAANYGNVGLNDHITVYLGGSLVFGTPPSGAPARVGVIEESTLNLQVRVLGNPITGNTAEVEIMGVVGQVVHLKLVDLQGHLIDEQRVEQAGESQRISLPLGSSYGQLLLRVSTADQQQSLKLLRP